MNKILVFLSLPFLVGCTVSAGALAPLKVDNKDGCVVYVYVGSPSGGAASTDLTIPVSGLPGGIRGFTATDDGTSLPSMNFKCDIRNTYTSNTTSR